MLESDEKPTADQTAFVIIQSQELIPKIIDVDEKDFHPKKEEEESTDQS